MDAEDVERFEEAIPNIKDTVKHADTGWKTSSKLKQVARNVLIEHLK